MVFLDGDGSEREQGMQMATRQIRKSAGYAAATAVVLATVASGHADTFAAKVTVTGTTDATTFATVVQQTTGPTLTVATSPANFGDLSLLYGGNPLAQANGVIIATPNQFRYAAVGDRNMIEAPGELTATVPGGFPAGMWLSTTKVSGGGLEDNFNFSMVHFGFNNNWTAGHVNGTSGALFAGNGAGVTITTQFNTPNASYGLGHYALSIAGVNSVSDGMLFATGAANSSSGNVVPVGILPGGTGWDVRVNDQGGNFPATEQANWSFVYVPYTADNLVAGGRLSLSPLDNSSMPPTSLDVLNSVGTFSTARVDLGPNGSITAPGTPDGQFDAGRFLITIPGKDDTTGTLLVGVSKYATASGNSGADDNFLAYEYSSLLGGWLVETYDLAGANLQNSDIYFAYFDYNSPISVPEPGSLALVTLGALVFGYARCRTKRPV